ncbi:MAG: ureidoglycolate lyase [Planctomycetaceae bacterium]
MPSRTPSLTAPIDQIPSINDPEISVIDVPLVSATAESLSGLAALAPSFETADVEIVTWPTVGWRPVIAGTGDQGGVTSGEFEVYRQGQLVLGRNHAVGGYYITGWFGDPATASGDIEPTDASRVLVCEANYHPDGGQVFCPRDAAPFVALLAPAGDDVTPRDFIAYYCDGTFGVNLHPGTWHQPLYPVGDRVVFDDKQGRVHACIAVNFAVEFGVFLSVPLTEPTAGKS